MIYPYSNEKQGPRLLTNMINSLPIPEHIHKLFPSKVITFLEREAELYKPIHKLIEVSNLFWYTFSVCTRHFHLNVFVCLFVYCGQFTDDTWILPGYNRKQLFQKILIWD